MRSIDDLVAAMPILQRSDLEIWIREELVVPRQEAGTLLFGDMECARVRLICMLHYELDLRGRQLIGLPWCENLSLQSRRWLRSAGGIDPSRVCKAGTATTMVSGRCDAIRF
jgi:hypothetical protein